MTEAQIKLITALAGATILPSHPDKRFVKDMADKVRDIPQTTLTDRQVWYLNTLAWRYRAQLPADVVPASKPA